MSRYSAGNGSPFRANGQALPMASANERAKLKPPITFHGLRHTWASLAVMNGVPPMVVAKNLGHRDTRMVEKHYGHLRPVLHRRSHPRRRASIWLQA